MATSPTFAPLFRPTQEEQRTLAIEHVLSLEWERARSLFFASDPAPLGVLIRRGVAIPTFYRDFVADVVTGRLKLPKRGGANRLLSVDVKARLQAEQLQHLRLYHSPWELLPRLNPGTTQYARLMAISREPVHDWLRCGIATGAAGLSRAHKSLIAADKRRLILSIAVDSGAKLGTVAQAWKAHWTVFVRIMRDNRKAVIEVARLDGVRALAAKNAVFGVR